MHDGKLNRDVSGCQWCVSECLNLSQSCHQSVTNMSRFVTEMSPIGHKLVTRCHGDVRSCHSCHTLTHAEISHDTVAAHLHFVAAQSRSSDDSRFRSPTHSSEFFWFRRSHTWPHEAPEAARPLQSARDWMLVRCCIPSTRYALSAAAVWPPAGLPGAPLLENAS